MTEVDSITARFQAGEEVEARELVARMDELEASFEDRGFAYIAVNGWLIPALDADAEARELMFLRSIERHLQEIGDGRAVLAARASEEAGHPVAEVNGRYGPDGFLYAPDHSAPAHRA